MTRNGGTVGCRRRLKARSDVAGMLPFSVDSVSIRFVGTASDASLHAERAFHDTHLLYNIKTICWLGVSRGSLVCGRNRLGLITPCPRSASRGSRSLTCTVTQSAARSHARASRACGLRRRRDAAARRALHPTPRRRGWMQHRCAPRVAPKPTTTTTREKCLRLRMNDACPRARVVRLDNTQSLPVDRPAR